MLNFARAWPRTANAIIVVGAFLVACTAAEVVLRFAWLRSDAFGTTVASRQWRKRHWRPINAQGYRDPAWDLRPGRKRVVLLGDSFIAGAGIENIGDRLDWHLRRRFADHSFFTIAQCGWDTPDELRALATLPFSADRVILGYYMNDIGAPRVPLPPVSSGLWLVEKSALLNFVWWSFHRRDNTWTAYAAATLAQYHDPGVWDRHRRELDALLAACRAFPEPPLIILFPLLTAPDHPAHETMRAYFRFTGNEVVDVAALLHKHRLGVAESIVNPLDPHPSVRLLALLADEVSARLAAAPDATASAATAPAPTPN